MNKDIVSSKPETNLKSIAAKGRMNSVIYERFVKSNKALKEKIFNVNLKFRKLIPTELVFANELTLISKYIINNMTRKMKINSDISNAYEENEIWPIAMEVRKKFKQLLNTERVSVLFNTLDTKKKVLVYIDKVTPNGPNKSPNSYLEFKFENGFFKFIGDYHITIIFNIKFIESIINTGVIFAKSLAPKEWFNDKVPPAILSSQIYNLFLSNVYNSADSEFSSDRITRRLNDDIFNAFCVSIYVEQLRLNNSEILKSIYSILMKEYPNRYSKSNIIAETNTTEKGIFSFKFQKKHKDKLDTIKNIVDSKDTINYPNIFNLSSAIYDAVNPFVLHELIYESVNSHINRIFKKIPKNEIASFIPSYEYLDRFESNSFAFRSYIQILKYNRILPTIYLTAVVMRAPAVKLPVTMKIYNAIRNLYLKNAKQLTKKDLFDNVGLLVTEFEILLNSLNSSNNTSLNKSVLNEIVKHIDPGRIKSYHLGIEELKTGPESLNDFEESMNALISEERRTVDLSYLTNLTDKLVRLQSQFNNPEGKHRNSRKLKFNPENSDKPGPIIIPFRKVTDIYEAHVKEWDDFYKRETKFKKLYDKMIVQGYETFLTRKDQLKEEYDNFIKAEGYWPLHLHFKKFNLTDDFWNDEYIRLYLSENNYTVKKIVFKGFFREFSEYMNYKMRYIRNCGYSCDFDGKSFFFNLCLFNDDVEVSSKK